jgi:hypothetical protein
VTSSANGPFYPILSQPQLNVETSPGAGLPGGKQPKQYRSPRLCVIGQLLSVTLGGSPGSGDSGSLNTQNPPYGLP